MSPADSAVADRIWDEIVAAEIEERDERARAKRIARFVFRQVVDWLGAAVVKQFMDELERQQDLATLDGEDYLRALA